MRFSVVTLLLFATLAVAQTTHAPKKTTPDNTLPSEQTVQQFFHHMFGYDENLKYRIVDIKHADDPALSEIDAVISTPQGQQSLKLYITPDQKYAISGEFVPFGADPFADAREKLKKANGPSRGPANDAVTIVEFGDLQCPACKRAQPTIEKLMTDVPNARLIFQQFPLTQIHRWAMLAAKYGVCVAKQNNDAYWKFIDTVYQNQDAMQQMTEEQVAPKLKQYAGESGVNADQVEKCTADPSTESAINSSIALGAELDITGTPTLFINGRRIANVGGMPYETLKSLTEFQAQSAK